MLQPPYSESSEVKQCFIIQALTMFAGRSTSAKTKPFLSSCFTHIELASDMKFGVKKKRSLICN